jgi:hypothetical protein
LIGHRHGRNRRIAVDPALDGAGARVEHDAEAPERPAVVGHGNEEAGGQTIERRDLAADERHAAAESHRADPEPIDLPHDRGFELRQARIGIAIVERAEQLLFRRDVP